MKINLRKPPRDGAEWTCPQNLKLDGWPYVARCGAPVVGLMPSEVAEKLKVYAAVCADHHKAFEVQLSNISGDQSE